MEVRDRNVRFGVISGIISYPFFLLFTRVCVQETKTALALEPGRGVNK